MSDFTGASGSHTYPGSGTYTAAFQVTDNVSDTDLVTMTVLVYDNGGTPGDYTDDSDHDSDGLPDGWEIDNFGDFSEDGSGDSDGDGFTNLEEYQNGTDPNVAGPGIRTAGIYLKGDGIDPPNAVFI